MKPIVIVLSKYPDLFKRLKDGLAEHEPGVSRLLVRDGLFINPVPVNWGVIDAPSPFIYSRNVNLAWKYTDPADVILIGDDVVVTGPFVETLTNTAYRDEWCGCACAQLHGQSPFVCGYFKRSVIDKVGYLDEQFTGYGYEDNDWFKRMEKLTYWTLPVEIPVSHQGGTSFYRNAAHGGESVQDGCDHNRLLFNKKWGRDGNAK